MSGGADAARAAAGVVRALLMSIDGSSASFEAAARRAWTRTAVAVNAGMRLTEALVNVCDVIVHGQTSRCVSMVAMLSGWAVGPDGPGASTFVTRHRWLRGVVMEPLVALTAAGRLVPLRARTRVAPPSSAADSSLPARVRAFSAWCLARSWDAEVAGHGEDGVAAELALRAHAAQAALAPASREPTAATFDRTVSRAQVRTGRNISVHEFNQWQRTSAGDAAGAAHGGEELRTRSLPFRKLARQLKRVAGARTDEIDTILYAPADDILPPKLLECIDKIRR